MERKPRNEIVLATWAMRDNDTAFFGDSENSLMDDTSSPLWLALRLKDLDDPTGYSYGREHTAAQHVGLYVWLYAMSETFSYHVTAKAHDVHSAEAHELEAMLKIVKRLGAKLPKMVKGETPADYVIAALDALRIRHAVQYHGIGAPDTIVPIREVMPRLRRLIDARVQRCTERLVRHAA